MPIKSKIVLVPFPFDDFTSSKVRPALCLTDPIGPHRHVVLAFMTSQMPPDLLDTDLVLEVTHPDFALTGLKGPAVVRLHRIMTTATSFLQRELGRLSPTLEAEVASRLRKVFEL